MKYNFLLIVGYLIFFLNSSFNSAKAQENYQFSNPCAYYTLPDTLYEISGLTDVDSSHIGCVQDEKGMIFLYNLYEAKIDSRSTFYFDGDYEGITRVGNDMYVLRSDGYLFRMRDYMLGTVVLRDSFATQIPINNNEGLCYDEKNNVLLIAAKGKIKKSKDTRDLRFIYGFRLDSLIMADTAVLVIDIDNIASQMKVKGVDVPYTIKKNGELKYENLKFMPSSIAVHPLSDRFYILSAVDRLLVILNRTGTIEDVIELPSSLFPKPEGITFLPNGDLLISNEGNGGKANLMRFCY
jgi:hypothetical protein